MVLRNEPIMKLTIFCLFLIYGVFSMAPGENTAIGQTGRCVYINTDCDNDGDVLTRRMFSDNSFGGIYEEYMGCDLADYTTTYTEQFSYTALCFKIADGSDWRIINANCGWEIGKHVGYGNGSHSFVRYYNYYGDNCYDNESSPMTVYDLNSDTIYDTSNNAYNVTSMYGLCSSQPTTTTRGPGGGSTTTNGPGGPGQTSGEGGGSTTTNGPGGPGQTGGEGGGSTTTNGPGGPGQTSGEGGGSTTTNGPGGPGQTSGGGGSTTTNGPGGPGQTGGEGGGSTTTNGPGGPGQTGGEGGGSTTTNGPGGPGGPGQTGSEGSTTTSGGPGQTNGGPGQTGSEGSTTTSGGGPGQTNGGPGQTGSEGSTTTSGGGPGQTNGGPGQTGSEGSTTTSGGGPGQTNGGPGQTGSEGSTTTGGPGQTNAGPGQSGSGGSSTTTTSTTTTTTTTTTQSTTTTVDPYSLIYTITSQWDLTLTIVTEDETLIAECENNENSAAVEVIITTAIQAELEEYSYITIDSETVTYQSCTQNGNSLTYVYLIDLKILIDCSVDPENCNAIDITNMDTTAVAGLINGDSLTQSISSGFLDVGGTSVSSVDIDLDSYDISSEAATASEKSTTDNNGNDNLYVYAGAGLGALLAIGFIVGGIVYYNRRKQIQSAQMLDAARSASISGDLESQNDPHAIGIIGSTSTTGLDGENLAQEIQTTQNSNNNNNDQLEIVNGGGEKGLEFGDDFLPPPPSVPAYAAAGVYPVNSLTAGGDTLGNEANLSSGEQDNDDNDNNNINDQSRLLDNGIVLPQPPTIPEAFIQNGFGLPPAPQIPNETSGGTDGEQI